MTDETHPEAPKRNPLAEEAALWFARMRGPEAERHRPAFDAWLARGTLHRLAYNRAAEIFSNGKFLREAEDLTSRRTPESRPRSDELRARRRGALVPLIIVAICMAIFIGLAVVANPARKAAGSDPGSIASERKHRLSETEYSTQTGQIRSEKLADGSLVTLRPNSRLVVVFDQTRRNLRLEAGRARFEVAHERRPFVVFAGGGSVTARGTIFDVSIGAGHHVTVRLQRGNIDVVEPIGAPAPKRLVPGQTLVFEIPSVHSVLDAPKAIGSAAAQTARISAMREFDRIRLSDLIVEANKGAAIQIRLADPALMERTVSGRFRVDDPEKLAERLALIFNLHLHHDTSTIILSGR